MAANDYLGVLTLVGQQKLAAAIGGTPLVLQTLRVGDGNGAEITPNETMVDLVHRVGNAYGVVSSGRDPVNLQMWRVTSVIPETDGPFNIREIGVFDADGDLIAIARHPLVEKRAPGQGAAVELTTDIVFPVSSTAQITVNFLPDSGVDIARLMRPPFIAVNSATVRTPPAISLQGDLYLVPAAPTGAWSGSVGKLMMWNGIVWRMATAPTGSVVCASDTGIYWRKTASGWTEWHATTDDRGLIELATNAEVQAGTDTIRAVTPASLSARTATIDRTGLVELATTSEATAGTDATRAVTPSGLAAALLAIPEGIHVMTSYGVFTVPAGVTKIDVAIWGGGGGGGSTGMGGSSGGAGAGGHARKLISVTPGQQLTGIVGAGGAAGALGGGGGTGGNTSFGPMTAYGGSGGRPNPSGDGGQGGSAAGGDINSRGGDGSSGAAGSDVTGGAGGGSPFGGPGGGAGHGISAGGAIPGGGGAGGGSSYSSSGGAGAPGLIIIRW
ncbi:phage tail protein [Pseudochelatococcus sp. G4_1912]|uniref:phage tail-collar fiber domain-containing protein n=1 Tax=Pseudochelatococcus sp. G4_1912 TaxID=3114288 RepID=UPI0039C62DD2